jgi:RNA polymerase sigma factor (sigma-70 family)
VEDLDDFEAILRAEGPRIYTLAIRLCGNTADGSDLAQETFINAWRHWKDFRKESHVGTWLYRICVNLWKNRVRYEKRRSFWKHVSLNGSSSDEDAPKRELADGAPALDALLEKAEEGDRVSQAMSKLDPQDRALLTFREIEDKPYEEIAQLLDVPLGTVKSRIARARDKLTQEFSRIER